jgi:hypothetical protein
MSDELEVLKKGDGGGEIWQRIEKQLYEPPAVPLVSRILESVGLSGSPLEAALRFSGMMMPVFLLASISSLVLGLFLHRSQGNWSLLLLLLAPCCSSLIGALGFRQELDANAELIRSSSDLRLLLLARQMLVYSLMLMLVLPFAAFIPFELLSKWLVPIVFLNAIGLAIGLHFGSHTGLATALFFWVWLVLLELPREPSKQAIQLPDFPSNTIQILLTLVLLLSVWFYADKPRRFL